MKIYANGQGARYSSALGTYVGNMFLGATTWVVGIFLALLILSFKDIGQLIGLSNITVGSKLGEPGGLLEYFTFNIFIPFGFLMFLTAVAINIYPIIRHKGTSVHKNASPYQPSQLSSPYPSSGRQHSSSRYPTE